MEIKLLRDVDKSPSGGIFISLPVYFYLYVKTLLQYAFARLNISDLIQPIGCLYHKIYYLLSKVLIRI